LPTKKHALIKSPEYDPQALETDRVTVNCCEIRFKQLSLSASVRIGFSGPKLTLGQLKIQVGAFPNADIQKIPLAVVGLPH
jgi:hypothetical protein